ncbi:MAG: hypothetical protein ACXVRK_12390 [Gaiellaceae bacterium]
MDERVEKAVRDTAALLERLGHELVEHTPDYPLLLPLASIARILPGMAADTAGLPHRSLEGVTTLLFTASRGGRINLAIVSARFPSGWSRLRPRSASG